jgi:GxxExxY protein
MEEGPRADGVPPEGMRRLNHERHEKHEPVVYAAEVFRIQGAVFEVSRQMGSGFLEAVYQECLAVEFRERGIPFQALRALSLKYKGQALKQTYTPDFVCFDSIILELKVARELAPEHRAQVINYLRATELKLGLLVNFGTGTKAKIERIVR